MSFAPSVSYRSFKPALSGWLFTLRFWLPALTFACIIAVESTATFGSNRTSQPLHDLLSKFFGASINNNWDVIHHFIRKTGHFVGYGLMSLAAFRGFWMTLKHRDIALRPTCHVLSIGATALVASMDEIHQSFLPNRTGCFSDVVLDTAGAIILQSSLALVWHIARKATATDD